MAVELELLFVVIPEVPDGAPFHFHPISRSKKPVLYKPADLRDTGEAQTPWVTLFEEILLGIYWKTKQRVPYMFRTADDTVRSLDAGCMKWLFNRKPPELKFHLDHEGIIVAVTPSSALLSRHEANREKLVARVSRKKAVTS